MESRIAASYCLRVCRFVLHRRHGPLGTPFLLRLHGATVWLDARAGDFGKRAEQIGGGAIVRIFRRMDSGPLWSAPAHADGNFDGGGGVYWDGKHLEARDVLFFLHV